MKTTLEYELPEEAYDQMYEHIYESNMLTLDGFIRHTHKDAIPAQTGDMGRWGPFEIRPMKFEGVGSVVNGHCHSYDHITFIDMGTLLVSTAETPSKISCPYCAETGEVAGKQCAVCKGRGKFIPEPSWSKGREYEFGNFMWIPAGRLHKFTCVKAPARAFCVRVFDKFGQDFPLIEQNEYMPDYNG